MEESTLTQLFVEFQEKFVFVVSGHVVGAGFLLDEVGSSPVDQLVVHVVVFLHLVHQSQLSLEILPSHMHRG
jgi:hypothetical protein